MLKCSTAVLRRHVDRLVAGAFGAQATDRELLQRFSEQHEQAAFEALFRRHAAMVLAVARRVLGNAHDAEDVCQAAFLLLARKAGAQRWQASVASWLYKAAHQLALKLRTAAMRRTRREGNAAPPRSANPLADISAQELLALLDEELLKLPERLRAPLVLCYLQGATRDEAAKQLGCPLATLKKRLERGRGQLHASLARRGLGLSAVVLGTLLSQPAAGAATAFLAHKTALAATALAAGKPLAGVISSRVIQLLEGGLGAMCWNKLKVTVALLLLGGLLCTASLHVGNAHADKEAAMASQPAVSRDGRAAALTLLRPEEQPAGKPSADPDKNSTIEVSGGVVDPEGKPVAGAKVFFARYILGFRNRPTPAVTSDAEGRFRLRVARTGYGDDSEKAQWMQGAVVAVSKGAGVVSKGAGVGSVGDDNAEKLQDVTIRLVKDVPIEGRVVDLQGKPIAGVSVQVREVSFRENGTGLKDFVEALRSGRIRFGWWNHPARPRLALDPDLLGLTRTTTTAADGKFRLTGISGECLVVLRFEGPTIETAQVHAMTRPGPTIHLPPDKEQLGSRPEVFHGATFEHAAAPTRPIVGIVRDKDTGKPLAGVTIQNETYLANRGPGAGIERKATTDAEGRYRIVGLSREAGHSLLAVPPPELPYLRAALTSKSTGALDPVTVDFSLKRAVIIRGRVTMKETGRPVSALVEYFALDDNPNLREAPGYRDSHSIDVPTGEDGSFTVLALPGRGLIAARVADREQQGRYLMAVGADEIKGLREDGNFITHPNICYAPHYNTLVEVNPAKDAESITRDVVFDPGKIVTGTIVDPDGQPVNGVSIDSVFGVWHKLKDLPTAQFRIPGVDPKHPRAFFFRHRGKNLGAAVLFKGDEPMPVTVRLQKCATLTGRLVDEDGRPRSSWIAGYIHKGQLNITGGVGYGTAVTDKDGRFQFKGVIPGLKIGFHAGNNPSFFDQHLIPELTLKAGEVRDLGDLKRKPME